MNHAAMLADWSAKASLRCFGFVFRGNEIGDDKG